MDTGVYCILNLLNLKRYIGSSSRSLAKRLTRHRHYLNKGTHHNEHLQRAWSAEGSYAFKFKILERCSPEQCVKREQYWITHYLAYDRERGYNKTLTAGSPLGYKHSKKAKRNMSAAAKGKKKSASHIANIRAAKQNMTDSTKEKMSNYAKNRSPEHRKKLAEAAKRRTEERRPKKETNDA